jgi:predicted Zn finger-like uncharacterized protein
MDFRCPHCAAIYKVIRAEAGPETNDREVICLHCGAPLPAREGRYVLKYFFVGRGPRA